MNTTTPETNAVAVVDQQAPYQTSSLMLNPQLMTQMMAVAQAMSEAHITVPEHFRGKPGDCLAVVMQATQWNMNPFTVAQKTHIVSGKLGYEAQLVNAVLEASRAIEGAFKYEYSGTGNALQCRVGAVCRGDREITWGEWLCIADITTKNSPLWKTNPKQQMGYLQVKNWARAYKPGALLGVYTPDELAAPGERFMGNVDEVRPPGTPPAPEPKAALPDYPADKFEANLPTWRSKIVKGDKTADEYINWLDAKYTLSEQQKAAIRAPAPGAADTDGVITMTFAQVADRLTTAKDLDALGIAADLITAVADEQQRTELQALYVDREEALK